MDFFKSVTLAEAVTYEKRQLYQHRVVDAKNPRYDIEAAYAKLDDDVAMCVAYVDLRPVAWSNVSAAFVALPRVLQKTLMTAMPDACFSLRFLTLLLEGPIYHVPCRPATYPYFLYFMTYNPARFRSAVNDGLLRLDERMFTAFEKRCREPVECRRRRNTKRDWAPRKRIVRCNLCLATCPTVRWPPCVSHPAFKHHDASLDTFMLKNKNKA